METGKEKLQWNLIYLLFGCTSFFTILLLVYGVLIKADIFLSNSYILGFIIFGMICSLVCFIIYSEKTIGARYDEIFKDKDI